MAAISNNPAPFTYTPQAQTLLNNLPAKILPSHVLKHLQQQFAARGLWSRYQNEGRGNRRDGDKYIVCICTQHQKKITKLSRDGSDDDDDQPKSQG